MLKSFINCLPPAFVFLLIGWSYYSYVIQYCTAYLIGITKKTLYLVFYHIILAMFTWSFLNTMCNSHDPVPNEYHLSPSENARLLTYNEHEADSILKKIIDLRKLEIYTCTPNGRIRYCKVCMQIKPDRTHHCATCDKCVMKMDHHCPWIANCVGYSNYKQFVLMLLYGTMWCIFYVGTIAEHIIEIWRDFQNSVSKVMLGVGFVVAALSGVLLSILFFYHVGLITRNETTLESLRETTFRQDNLTFDVGRWNNFTEVFGNNVCCWFIPTRTGLGNAHEFRVNNLIA